MQPPPPPPPAPSPLPPPPPPPASGSAAPARWRDLRGLAIALVALFGVMLCASALLAVALFHRLSVIHDLQAGHFAGVVQRASDADDYVGGAAAFYGLTQLAIIVVFIIWQFRAAKNNEALDRWGARFGPGWSIGAWFIPLANLVIPVLIFQDLWRGSTATTPRGDQGWRRGRGSWLIAAWWAVWVLSLLRFGASSAGRSDGSFDGVETSNTVALVGVVATMVAAVLAAWVVWALSRRQLDTLRAQRAVYEGADASAPV